jgi:flagellar hook-length control protein FliK
MEPLASLPAELAAIADPSARGAAPLLRPPGAGGPPPPSVLPFGQLLELLTERPPSGQAWPADGKELPLPSLEAVTDAAPLARFAVLMTPPALAEASAVSQDASTVRAPESFDPAGSPLPLGRQAPLPLRLPLPPSVEPAERPSTSAAPLPLELESLLMPVDSEAAPPEPAVPRAAAVPANVARDGDALDAVVADEARPRVQPATTVSAERRAAAFSFDARAQTSSASAAVPTTSVPAGPPAQFLRAADRPPAPQGGIRRLDGLAFMATSAAATDATSVVTSDWLPPAGASGATATSAAAPLSPTLPSTPMDVRTPNWQEAFASRVQWLVDAEVGEARLKLNPPELGAVDVKISLLDDKTYVQLTTATAAARDELAQSLPRLRELFTASGLELGGASVHTGREQRQATGDGYGAASAEARTASGAPERLEDAVPLVARRLPGRIDVFA